MLRKTLLAVFVTLTSSAYAQVPDAIAAPGKVSVARFHAEGAQIYECKAGANGALAWQFREPIATLLAAGVTVGRHYAGPSWELTDGSIVVGKVAASAAGATPADIAWLRLDVISHLGAGRLDGVTTVQRIDTTGGAAPATCSTVGRFLSVPYAADYVFLGDRMPLASAPLTADKIAQIVGSPDRSAADRRNDLRRRPEPLLAFIGIHPGITAFDVSAAGGYTTELLARAVGPAGKVYGQNQPRDPNRAPPAAPEGNSNPGMAAAATVGAPPSAPVTLASREQALRSVGGVPIIAISRPFDDPFPPELAANRVDLVTLMFNYHDMGHLGVDRAAMNRAVFRALMPGGHYVIGDHAGRPGTGISESGTLHRIEEAFLRQEVEAAGFRLEEEGTFLRNPNDPRDKNTPDPPQPKDEFVLKFVKP